MIPIIAAQPNVDATTQNRIANLRAKLAFVMLENQPDDFVACIANNPSCLVFLPRRSRTAKIFFGLRSSKFIRTATETFIPQTIILYRGGICYFGLRQFSCRKTIFININGLIRLHHVLNQYCVKKSDRCRQCRNAAAASRSE